MEEKLISKRQLLERYGISYGALYRWKRKGLIPDEWFLRKSTPTGQETFFPEDAICRRVERILSAKDEQSLEEIARHLDREKAGQKQLILRTVYGERRIPWEQVQAVLFSNGTNETDFTQQIAAMAGEEKTNE